MASDKSSALRRFRFSLLSSYGNVVHAVFTRRGGVSSPPFDSLNVDFSTGDEAGDVNRNRSRIVKSFSDTFVPVFLRQVHGDHIVVIDQQTSDTDLPEADGAVTDTPDRLLFVQMADCQSVLMLDPKKGVVANVHSGWRSSIQNIIGKCVEKMRARFQTDPADIIAGIGPSLGPCCAEFVNYKDEIPEAFWRYRRPGTTLFDFWQLSRDQLESSGVKPVNVENMKICTKCFSDLFFSYRNDRLTGRFASVIGISDKQTEI